VIPVTSRGAAGSETGGVLSGGVLVTRALRSQTLWLTLTYMLLLALVARGYA
jgi:hypothetical protein